MHAAHAAHVRPKRRGVRPDRTPARRDAASKTARATARDSAAVARSSAIDLRRPLWTASWRCLWYVLSAGHFLRSAPGRLLLNRRLCVARTALRAAQNRANPRERCPARGTRRHGSDPDQRSATVISGARRRALRVCSVAHDRRPCASPYRRLRSARSSRGIWTLELRRQPASWRQQRRLSQVRSNASVWLRRVVIPSRPVMARARGSGPREDLALVASRLCTAAA